MHRYLTLTGLAIVLAIPSRGHAYIEAAHSFGQVVAQSSNIVLIQVTAIDREKNLIIYRKVRDIKGTHPTDVIKHNIGRGGLRPNEWKPPMEWAEPGRMAVFFYQGGASETCIGNWWYQAYAGGEWWNHSHGEPFLLRTYAGPPEKLPAIVTGVMEGKEMIASCMRDGDKETLHSRSARIQRLKVSLKLMNYDQKRDFVGWGGEDFRRVLGMPGFTHITALARTDPDAQAISCVDYDADGKPDLCLIGGGKLVILQNNGDSMTEVMLPGITGARSAVWADYNGDGLPDLFLVTPAGPRLFTNLGGGQLRNDSQILPPEAFYQLTAAAWTDADGDGRPDLLLGNGYHGLRLYRNTGLPIPKAPPPPRLGPWSYLGPVDNTGGRGFKDVHACEIIDLKATYQGKDGQKIAWKAHRFTDGTPNALIELFPPNYRKWIGIYLHRTIEVDALTELPISLGSDDTLTVWLDGKKIVSDPSNRAVAPDQNLVTLKLDPGRHDLLLKICQGEGEFAYYFNWTKLEAPPPQGLGFEDVSAQVGLGPDGQASGVKFDALVVQDVDGDGRPDFLYGNRLFLNKPAKAAKLTFVEAKDTGLAFVPHRTAPVFGDFDNDCAPDLVIPHKNGVKLYRNVGQGRFQDAGGRAGLPAAPAVNGAWVTSAAWGDIDNDGLLDLTLGCFKGPNRYLRNRGDGTFEDATDKIGLDLRIFNTQAVSCVDLNGDGQLDFVFNNEGQDSTILLGSGALASGKRTSLTLRLQGKQGLIGSRVQVLGKDGKLLAAQEASGGEGRGSQPAPLFRFALEPGRYQIQFRLSSGVVRSREFEIADSPVRGVLEE